MTIKINLPVSEADIRKLKIGDEVLLSGVMVTARDMAHKLMHEEAPDFIRPYLENSVIYHCGPVVRQREGSAERRIPGQSGSERGQWEFVAAGPTTSIREEVYEPEVIAHFGLRGVIGKGGMGPGTLRACQEHGAAYFHAVGGAASLIANAVKEVVAVHKKDEFGVPEAFWFIRVEHFPVVVTMDSHGRSIHEEVEAASKAALERLIAG